MDSLKCDWGVLSRVSPFRNRRIKGYLLLPGAYRSLSRLSSALSAKASTIRSFMLDQFHMSSVTYSGSGYVFNRHIPMPVMVHIPLCLVCVMNFFITHVLRSSFSWCTLGCLEYFHLIFNVQFSRNNLDRWQIFVNFRLWLLSSHQVRKSFCLIFLSHRCSAYMSSVQGFHPSRLFFL